MISLDRTAKMLLATIAILLAVIAFRQPSGRTDLPILNITPSAAAQATDGTAIPNSTTTSYGYKVAQISVISTQNNNPVKEVFTIPGTGCFAIRYADHVEVFSVVQATNARSRTGQ